MTTSQPKRLRIWIECLSAVGLFASILALRTHLLISAGEESAGSFCHISAQLDCAAVIGSEWSIFFGVPLASYGIIFYLSLFILALLSGERRLVSPLTAGRIFFMAGLISSLASIALFAISELKIGALCLMCITMYLVNFLILLRSWNLTEPESVTSRILSATRSTAFFPGLLLGTGASSFKNTMAAWVSLILGLPLAYLVMFPPSQLVSVEQNNHVSGRVAISSSLDGSALTRDYYKGSLSAAVEIVEFADFECPGCRRMYVFLDEFLKEFEGKYRLIFRNFPLDDKCNPTIPREFHKYACVAAQYSRCAGEQGKFWEALDFLFLTPLFEEHEVGANVEKLLIESGSKEIGLDGEAMQECISSNRHTAKIQSDIKEAARIGLQFTPSLWINGRFVDKPTPDLLRQIMNEEVNQATRQSQ